MTEIDHNTGVIITCFILSAVLIRLNAFVFRAILLARRYQLSVAFAEIAINLIRYPIATYLLIYFNSLNLINFIAVYFSTTIIEFFYYYVMQLSDLRLKLLPTKFILSSVAPHSRLLKVSAGSALIGLLLNQYDRLIFSLTLTLDHFGFFSLLATVCGVILVFPAPITRALLPRMTRLVALNDISSVGFAYQKASGLVATLLASSVVGLMLFPEGIMSAWLDDDIAVIWLSDLLPLYALSAFLVAVMTFQYQLQVAYGNLDYHYYYNVLNVFVSVPLITWSAFTMSPVFVASVVLMLRALPFFFWLPVIHRKFLPKLKQSSYYLEVGFPMLVAWFLVTLIESVLSYIGVLSEARIIASILISTSVLVAIYTYWNSTYLLTQFFRNPSKATSN